MSDPREIILLARSFIKNYIKNYTKITSKFHYDYTPFYDKFKKFKKLLRYK